MDKLQKENDSLRLDLVLSGMGIPSQTQAPVDLTTTLTPVPAEELLPLPSSGSNTNTSSSSDSSFTSSPPNLLNEFPDNWDFALADFSDSTLLNNQQDTYLSHALVPTWNLNQVLSKEQAQTSLVPSNHNQLFYQYPLLAPALMSVVLSHTMTMSTNELLASARLSPLNNGTMGTFFSEKNPLESSTTLNEKDAKAVWDILEPLTLLKERNEKFAKETKNSMVTQHVTNTDEITGLAYLQQSLCRYLCEFIASNCVTKVCKEKTTLCKRFKQAKRYITACE
jgi:hypothetical protein